MDQAKTLERVDDLTGFARGILDAEARAIRDIRIDDSFHQAVELILQADVPSKGTGSLVVSGLGKSGLIGQKLSATFASTGTPSHFLHPVEAVHGDLGRIRRGDVVLLLSYGGHTKEVVTLAGLLNQDQVPVIAIVGARSSDLARLAAVALPVGAIDEACPMNLAPTASAAAMLALGDAIALAVSRKRNFGVLDFQKLHPGGLLGRQLMSVTQVMRWRAGKNLPMVPAGLTLSQACLEAERFTERRVGAFLVVDPSGRLSGIFTDSDLRRLVIERGVEGLEEPIERVMTKQPHHLQHTALLRDAVQLAREHRIDEIPVVDADGRPIGLIDVQDLVAMKVIED